jgi:hypothetical protein
MLVVIGFIPITPYSLSDGKTRWKTSPRWQGHRQRGMPGIPVAWLESWVMLSKPAVFSDAA